MFPSRTMLKCPLDTFPAVQAHRNPHRVSSLKLGDWVGQWDRTRRRRHYLSTISPCIWKTEHYRPQQKHQGGRKGSVGVAFACTSRTSRWSEDNKALEQWLSHPSSQCEQPKHIQFYQTRFHCEHTVWLWICLCWDDFGHFCHLWFEGLRFCFLCQINRKRSLQLPPRPAILLIKVAGRANTKKRNDTSYQICGIAKHYNWIYLE